MKKITICYRSIVFVLLTISTLSCSSPIKDPAQLINYINDPSNGLRKTKEILGIEAELTFKPWQSFANERVLVAEQGYKQRLRDKLCFVFSLSANSKELLKQLDYNQYSEMIQVLSFRMSQFIVLIPEEGEKIEPEICLFEQTYGIGKSNNLLIVFDLKKALSAKKLTIKINEFGLNIGDLEYQFDKKDFTSLPAIDF